MATLVRLAAPLALLLALAGCSTPADQPLGEQTYSLALSGLSDSVEPGATFALEVDATMGHGMRMHEMASDHIGAHFWNASQSDPSGALSAAKGCSHTGGQMPGHHATTCTAPMEPGTYYIRAHARINETGTLHHWWGAQHMFTVA